MPISDRVARLGSGVFARNDQRKAAYQRRWQAAGTGGDPADLPPLLDLSLGSTDLMPPPEALAAMARALEHPSSASYCLHAATAPFREAVAAWAQRRFGERVDPEREVLLLVGSQEGTAHLPLAVLNPGEAALLAAILARLEMAPAATGAVPAWLVAAVGNPLTYDAAAPNRKDVCARVDPARAGELEALALQRLQAQ
jgi:hypothetical protein